MRRLTVVALATLLAACGSDSTGPQVNVVGTFTLKTVNGASLPALLQQTSAGKFEVIDDMVTLNADRSYTESGHLRATTNAGVVTTVPESDQGTYTTTNGAVQFVSVVGNGSTTGSVNGNTLTLIENGLTFVYSR